METQDIAIAKPRSTFNDRLIGWLKRPQVWGFFLSVAILAIISTAFFFPDNFEGNTLQQPDMVQGAANGEEGRAFEEATGEKALWTNSLFGGMPTFQISPSYPSNALFEWLNDVYGLWLPAPSNLLFMMMVGFLILLYAMDMRWYYALTGAIAWGFSSYFVIIIGAGHIWKFIALSYIPPTIAGLVLCYRGRLLAGTAITAVFAMLQLNANHPQMSYYFAFVMAGMAIAYLCYAIKDKRVKQWGIATVCLIGAGALALGANMPALYNTYEYAKETARGASELTAPTTSASDADKPAKAPTGGMDYAQIVNWSYTPDETVTLLIPNVKGGASAIPVEGHNEIMALSRIGETPAQLSHADNWVLESLPQYFNDTEGTNGPVYVGAIVCMLFLLGCLIVKGPMKWVLLVLTILSILLSWGRHFEWLTDLMVYHFPMYNKFRAVESILVIAEFTMPLLAVMGLRRFFKTTKPLGEAPSQLHQVGPGWQFWTAVGIPVAICVLAMLVPSVYGQAVKADELQQLGELDKAGYISDFNGLINSIEQLRYGLIRSDALRSLIFIALAASALYAYTRGWLKRAMAIAAIAVLIIFDLYTVGHRYVNNDSFVTASLDTSNPLEADAVDLEILKDKDLSYRVADFSNFGGARRSYYHKMIGGYHAAKLGRYDDLITTGLISSDAVLDMLNTRYIIFPTTDPTTGQKVIDYQQNPYALGNAWFVDSLYYVDGANAEFDALKSLNPATTAVADNSFKTTLGEARTVSPDDNITLTKYTPNRLTYDVKSLDGGVAVFSEVYFPWGWHASIDGKPATLGRVNYILRALKIPAGNHTVEMVFDPDSLHITGGIAYSCVTLIYLLVLGAVFQRFLPIKFKKNKL